METRQTKQVVIIRRDLKMRRGKEIAQACHAYMGVFSSHWEVKDCTDSIGARYGLCHIQMPTLFNKAVKHWLENSFAKITVYVESEQELLDLEKQAKDAGLLHCLIQDNGKTEFHGVKTYTALAIGLAESSDIDKITGHLKLY